MLDSMSSIIFVEALSDKKLAAGACLAFKEFASSPSLMPFVVQNLPKLIEALNDKQKPVVAAAKEALTTITDKMPVWAIGQVVPMLIDGMKGKPAQKEACVSVVASAAKRGKVQVHLSCSTQRKQGEVDSSEFLSHDEKYSA